MASNSFLNGKIVNPITKRLVRVGSLTYKKLVKNNVINSEIVSAVHVLNNGQTQVLEQVQLSKEIKELTELEKSNEKEVIDLTLVDSIISTVVDFSEKSKPKRVQKRLRKVKKDIKEITTKEEVSD